MLLYGESRLHPPETCRVRGLAVSVQIEAGAETSTCAREDDNAHRCVDSQLVEGIVQSLHKLGCHRVELCGTVECDLGDARMWGGDINDWHTHIVARWTGCTSTGSHPRASLFAGHELRCGVVSLPIDPAVDLRSTLSVFRYGSYDPTTQLGDHDFWRATLTPLGEATLHLRWAAQRLDAEAWGPGGDWMLDRVASMTGAADPGFDCPAHAHRRVVQAHRNHRGWRVAASGMLYHELLPNVLGQRVTAREALGQWRTIVTTLGTAAPGPNDSLFVPPTPQALLDHPAWWFHPLGVEAKRAEALRTVARYAERVSQWAMLSSTEASAKLQLLSGIGPWTIGAAVGPALGDADSIPVGDFHLPNMICFALAGKSRGSDAEMLELLEPYAGQRGRVIGLLGMDGNTPPKFGPRQRIQPMYRR